MNDQIKKLNPVPYPSQFNSLSYTGTIYELIKLVNDQSNNINIAIDDIEAFASQIENAEKEFETKITAHVTELENDIKSFESGMTTKFNDLQSAVNAFQTNITNDFNELKSATQLAINQMQGDLEELRKFLNDYIASDAFTKLVTDKISTIMESPEFKDIIDQAILSIGIATADKNGISRPDNVNIGIGADGKLNILPLSITTDKIANASINSDKIAPLSLTSEKYQDGSITTTKIANSSVTDDKLAVEAVTGSAISPTASRIRKASIGNSDLAISAVSSNNLQTGCVLGAAKTSASRISVQSIGTADIGIQQIIGARELGEKSLIKAKSLGYLDYGDGTITTEKIAVGAITGSAISPAAPSIKTASIGTADIGIHQIIGSQELGANSLIKSDSLGTSDYGNKTISFQKINYNKQNFPTSSSYKIVNYGVNRFGTMNGTLVVNYLAGFIKMDILFNATDQPSPPVNTEFDLELPSEALALLPELSNSIKNYQIQNAGYLITMDATKRQDMLTCLVNATVSPATWSFTISWNYVDFETTPGATFYINILIPIINQV